MGYNTMMASSARRPPLKGLAPINEVKRINIVHSVTKNVLNMANSASSADPSDPSCSVFCLFALLLYVPVYSYGHYGMVNSSNHSFSWVNDQAVNQYFVHIQKIRL